MDSKVFLKGFLCLFLALSALGCSDEDENKPGPDDGNLRVEAEDTGEIAAPAPRVATADGLAVSGAQVLIGTAPGVPFAGNVVRTDMNGRIPVPAAWKSPLPVTIEANGFVRATFVNVVPSNVVLEISETDGTDNIEIKGTTTEFGDLRRDGKVDFGLVIPSLTRRQMLTFDMSSVVSPEVDRISVGVTSFDVPSNLTLPQQRETYILPITLDKPAYRIYLRRPGFYRVSATHGQFPLKRVVDDLRNDKSVFDVINFFEFKGGGQIQLQADKSVANQNIAVNQLAFDGQTNVTGARLQTGEIMMSLALNENSGYMVPTDLKRLEAGQTLALKTARAGTAYILSVLLKEEDKKTRLADMQIERDLYRIDPFHVPRSTTMANSVRADQLSFAFENAGTGRAPTFLEMIDKARVNGTTLTLDRPALPAGLNALATHVILSEIEKIQKGDITVEKRTRLWEVSATNWVDSIQLPEVNWGRQNGKTYRWEVMYLARDPRGPSSEQGAYYLDAVTHVTRSSMDF